MRRALVIIFAVAILGGLSLYVNSGKDDNAQVTARPSSSATNSPSSGASKLKNGTYDGSAAETPYGTVRVVAVISGGKITDIKFLEMPDDEDRSRQITKDSKPLLRQAAIDAQSSDIDFVTGATSTSYGYQESLQAALDKAKTS